MTRIRRTKLLGAALIGAIAAACWLVSLLTAHALTQQNGGLSVRFPTATVTQRDLDRAAASSDGTLICAAAWSRTIEQKTASSALGRNAALRMIVAYGDMRQIAPMRLLCGSYPVDDDTSGCVVDAKSAMRLFHATDTIGAELTVDGELYVVRGIVEAYEPMLILRKNGAAYENLEFSAENLSAAKQLVETFLYRCNSEGDYIVVQSGLIAQLAHGLVWFAAVIYGVAGANAALRNAWANRGNKHDFWWRLLIGAALVTASVAVLIKTAFWPQSFLPTKWSDFAFWTTLWQGWEAQWKAVSLMTPLPKEIELFQKLLCSGVLLLAALLAGGWCAASLRARCNGREYRNADGLCKN